MEFVQCVWISEGSYAALFTAGMMRRVTQILLMCNIRFDIKLQKIE
jgi:hypothetical protein